MTDDLESLSDCPSVVARKSNVDERSSRVRAYEELLERVLAREEEVCLSWFRRYSASWYNPSDYNRIVDSLSFPNPPSVEDAHLAILRSGPTGERFAAGFVLSNVYCQSQNRVITYDLPFPLACLGGDLLPTQVLVNRSSLGRDAFRRSVGIVVNEGSLQEESSPFYGWFINLGSHKGVNQGERFGKFTYGIEGLYVDPTKQIVRGNLPLRFFQMNGRAYRKMLRPVQLSYLLSLSGTSDHAPFVARWYVHATAPQSIPSSEMSPKELLTWAGRGALFCHELSPREHGPVRPKADAAERFSRWLNRIGELAATDPERLLDQYARQNRPPHEAAQDELFSLLFDRSFLFRLLPAKRWYSV